MRRGGMMNKQAKGRATIPPEQLTYWNFVLIDALGELLCEKGLITLEEWRDRAKQIRDEKRDGDQTRVSAKRQKLIRGPKSQTPVNFEPNPGNER